MKENPQYSCDYLIERLGDPKLEFFKLMSETPSPRQGEIEWELDRDFVAEIERDDAERQEWKLLKWLRDGVYWVRVYSETNRQPLVANPRIHIYTPLLPKKKKIRQPLVATKESILTPHV